MAAAAPTTSATQQVPENTKSVITAAGLTMENVVYVHVYLRDMADFEIPLAA